MDITLKQLKYELHNRAMNLMQDSFDKSLTLRQQKDKQDESNEYSNLISQIEKIELEIISTKSKRGWATVSINIDMPSEYKIIPYNLFNI